MISQKKRSVYLDHAAATPLDRTVFLAMLPFLKTNFYNPSGLYAGGVQARAALEESRKEIGEILDTPADTIIFTSSGTESDNLAILGVARAHASHGQHIITTAIEHSAVLEPLKQLSKSGWDVTILPVDKFGLVTAEQVLGAVRPDTVLISIMYANNEIGALMPVAEIGRGIRRWRQDHKTVYPYFHTDACQAAGYLDLNVERLHVDALTLNAAKIYGPKGSALLYLRRGITLDPIIFGGDQERSIRPGTENVAGIVGLATALARAEKLRNKEIKKITNLSNYFWKILQTEIPGVVLNGPEVGERRLPNNLNITIPGLDAETALLYLDAAGIECATGSACTAVASTPSHVLSALGKSLSEIRGSLRFSLGRSTTKKDLDYTVRTLQNICVLLTR